MTDSFNFLSRYGWTSKDDLEPLYTSVSFCCWGRCFQQVLCHTLKRHPDDPEWTRHVHRLSAVWSEESRQGSLQCGLRSVRDYFIMSLIRGHLKSLKLIRWVHDVMMWFSCFRRRPFFFENCYWCLVQNWFFKWNYHLTVTWSVL